MLIRLILIALRSFHGMKRAAERHFVAIAAVNCFREVFLHLKKLIFIVEWSTGQVMITKAESIVDDDKFHR